MTARSRLIILEGPDGAGKSTLATELTRLMNITCVHFTAPSKETSFDAVCRERVCDVHDLLAPNESVIFDRFHLSERVYGPILRDVDTMRDDFESWLWEMVQPVVVLCLPPYDVAHQNWAKRNAERAELITEKNKFDAVYHAYRKLRTILPILQYDYTRDTAVDVFNRLTLLGYTIG